MKLPKTYEPSQYESDIYALWEKSNSFVPNNKIGSETFSIVMPPPNANGDLHLGHALTIALEDIVVRYNRLKGKSTVYIPGADHAGFETWVVYEKHLNKQGKTRFDYTREELYSQVWDFVQQNKNNFEVQLRNLGASCDWSRFTFTLDDKVVQSAYKIFEKLLNDKLIYRGERLVNFCTHHGTSFSDIEVTYKQVKGNLWYMRYPLIDGSGSITVATTRPETMFGDTAVAVNPEDKRYKDFIGKTISLPLMNREIPVIADKFVDKDFGTGAVKVTPAHDQNDYEIANRHDLPFISVINHEGNMTHHVPKKYQGLSVNEAREAVLEDLKNTGFLAKTEKYSHSVGHCYKCSNVIEPLLREQWFVDMKPLATKAIKALQKGDIKFYPSAKLDQAIEYLKNIRDWNISRQIAWGIPIPAFQNIDDSEDWIFDERVEQELIKVKGKTYKRDPDVFDTWFSSGQWPFVTLGYPDSDDFKKFYPQNLMETGGEILYQWVCRMIMLGLYVTGEVPFKEVYVHGYVMATDGTKMSKSLGNVVNPQMVIESFGSDALRMGIVSGRSPGVNTGYDPRRVEQGRNFCNKLWNIARFVEDKVGDKFKFIHLANAKSAQDYWMLDRLHYASEKISKDLENYRFSEAYDTLYHLVWNDFADWYIETSKAKPNTHFMAYCLDTILKIAHPFAPFVTETIWQTLAWEKDTILANAKWPKVSKSNHKKAEEFGEITIIISEIRNITNTLGIKDVTLYYNDAEFIKESKELIIKLASVSDVKSVESGYGLHLTQTKNTCWLDIDQKTAYEYSKKLLEKEKAQRKVITQLEARLKNKSYVDNAPSNLVKETKSQLNEAKDLLQKISNEYKRFTHIDI